MGSREGAEDRRKGTEHPSRSRPDAPSFLSSTFGCAPSWKIRIVIDVRDGKTLKWEVSGRREMLWNAR